ncbi:hypothetical protein K502DRAFT_330722 [Neoconidiobolus thromboides FSU 785]|nr:hypothetical protein K502DRAFT_330722 [Neoconidiobolus thromboides FSU 785]
MEVNIEKEREEASVKVEQKEDEANKYYKDEFLEGNEKLKAVNLFKKLQENLSKKHKAECTRMIQQCEHSSGEKQKKILKEFEFHLAMPPFVQKSHLKTLTQNVHSIYFELDKEKEEKIDSDKVQITKDKGADKNKEGDYVDTEGNNNTNKNDLDIDEGIEADLVAANNEDSTMLYEIKKERICIYQPKVVIYSSKHSRGFNDKIIAYKGKIRKNGKIFYKVIDEKKNERMINIRQIGDSHKICNAFEHFICYNNRDKTKSGREEEVEEEVEVMLSDPIIDRSEEYVKKRINPKEIEESIKKYEKNDYTSYTFQPMLDEDREKIFKSFSICFLCQQKYQTTLVMCRSCTLKYHWNENYTHCGSCRFYDIWGPVGEIIEKKVHLITVKDDTNETSYRVNTLISVNKNGFGMKKSYQICLKHSLRTIRIKLN